MAEILPAQAMAVAYPPSSHYISYNRFFAQIEDKMLSLNLDGPVDVREKVARRARQRRLHENLSQQGLAERAGVSLGSLKLFEQTGKASFETVVLIAFALGVHDEFSSLFPPPPPRSIEDVLDRPTRQRGRRK